MKLRNKKTGEVFDAIIREKGGNGAYSHIVCDIKAYEPNAGIKAEKSYALGEYSSLTEINEFWEDYKPAEPLIKDEKIRKAVRAWAEVNELKPDYEVEYDADMFSLNSWQAGINFNCQIDGLEHNKTYTIAELCGEEEECES